MCVFECKTWACRCSPAHGKDSYCTKQHENHEHGKDLFCTVALGGRRRPRLAPEKCEGSCEDKAATELRLPQEER